jgi:O-antigen/teichoic acid export membrane protein
MNGLQEAASIKDSDSPGLRAFISNQTKRFWGHRLYANSTYLIADQALTAITGFLFWVLVARLYSSEHLGLASALVSAIMLLANISILGFNFTFLRFIPDRTFIPEDIINKGLTTVALVSLVVVVIFLAGLRLWSPSLIFIHSSVSLSLTLILGTLAWSTFTLLDSAFIGLRRAIFVPIKNISNQGLRLLFVLVVFALGGLGVQGILSAWTFPILIVLALTLFRLLPSAGQRYKLQFNPDFWTDRETLTFSLLNYATNLSRLAPGYLFSIIIVNVVSEAAGAYFFVAWTISALLIAVSYSISNVLLSEYSTHSDSPGHYARMAFSYTGIVMIPATLILVFGGSYLLELYGSEYSSNASNILRLLILSALPAMINHVYLTLARLEKDNLAMVAFPSSLLLLSIILGSIFVQIWGATGVAIAWLLAQSIGALVVAPKVFKVSFLGQQLQSPRRS